MHLEEAQLRSRRRPVARMTAAAGPSRTFFDPDDLATRLHLVGFGGVDILAPEQGNEMYFPDRSDGLKSGGGPRIASACT